MLGTRILTAAVLVPLTLAALFLLGPVGWGLATLVIVVVGAAEWAGLAGYPQRIWALFAGGVFLIGLTLLFARASAFSPERGWPAAVTVAICGAATVFWLLVAPLWLAARWRVASRLTLALVGLLLLLATWVAVVQLQSRSPWLLLALMAVVWIADTAAYFAGRAFGRHKLAPSISPGKTWEGVYGALLATAVYAVFLLRFAPDRIELSAGGVAAWITGLLALTALSIVGDLFESLLKRQRGVKDSGKLLPGHGGVLDRIDALLAAMPAAALMAQYALR